MNEIIAKKLYEQLRVLGIYLNEYDIQLRESILGNKQFEELKTSVKHTSNSIINFLNEVNYGKH